MVPTSATTKTFGGLKAMRWIKSIRKSGKKGPALLLGRHHDRVSKTSKRAGKHHLVTLTVKYYRPPEGTGWRSRQ
jgi:hypothetical protein